MIRLGQWSYIENASKSPASSYQSCRTSQAKYSDLVYTTTELQVAARESFSTYDIGFPNMLQARRATQYPFAIPIVVSVSRVFSLKVELMASYAGCRT